MKLRWTLLIAGSLGRIAYADSDDSATVDAMTTAVMPTSHRGVAENYLVMPTGGELTGEMKFLTADAAMDGKPLEFTDVALFGLSGRWALFDKLEVSGAVDFLAKQPSYTDEAIWQSAQLGLRTALGKHVALAAAGGVGELIDHNGLWSRESLMLEWKKQVDREWLAFDIQAGLDGLQLNAPQTSAHAFFTEAGVQTSALFHEPTGHWGGWVGIAYAVPIYKMGEDPTTNVAIDPQPRVDFHLGTVLSIVQEWDLFVDFSVIDRGDASNPATQLPILDGGFDQKPIV